MEDNVSNFVVCLILRPLFALLTVLTSIVYCVTEVPDRLLSKILSFIGLAIFR